MELSPDCSTAEVRKGYKKMALVLHPDKNDAQDADIQFRYTQLYSSGSFCCTV